MTDYARNTDDRDLIVKNSDFVRTESREQHIEALFLTNKGELKLSPLTGVDAVRYVKGNLIDLQGLRRELTNQAEADGLGKIDVKINKDLSLDIE